jgi:hypothetical protein
MTYRFESVMNIGKISKGKIAKPFKCQKIATQIPNTSHIACALNSSMSFTGSASFAYTSQKHNFLSSQNFIWNP